MSALSTYDFRSINAMTQVVSGLSLAHQRLDVPQRRSLVEALADGSVVVTPMTIGQASAVAQLSRFATYSARHRRPSAPSAAPEPALIVPTSSPVADGEEDALINRAVLQAALPR